MLVPRAWTAQGRWVKSCGVFRLDRLPEFGTRFGICGDYLEGWRESVVRARNAAANITVRSAGKASTSARRVVSPSVLSASSMRRQCSEHSSPE